MTLVFFFRTSCTFISFDRQTDREVGPVVHLFLLTDRQRSWIQVHLFLLIDRQTDKEVVGSKPPHMGRSLREGGREGGRVRKVR